MNVNIASAAHKANPFPFYARLRAEAPVCRVTLPDKQSAWIISRYDDVVATLKDERLVKDKFNALTPEQATKQPWVPGFFKPLTRNMLDLDAPDHTRLKGLVHKAFTPRLIEQMRVRIETLTEELLDDVERRGQFDLIRDYALPLPTTIIAEMLGIPAEDGKKFNRWSSAIVASNQGSLGMLKAIPNIAAFMSYLRKLIKVRRANPQDDLISALVAVEETGDLLNEDELLAMIFLLLVAGHETTVNLIGNGVLALLEHPDQMERLRSDPTLIKPAVEELLRYNGPLETATERYAREEITIEGVTIPRGGLVFAALASANRDESQFPNADTLDLNREPNRHLAFGQGVHYCMGAPLARMEGQIAINTLLRRMPDLRLAVAPGALRWRSQLVLHSLEALPLTFGRQRRTA